jgi:transcription elongation factor Elf1
MKCKECDSELSKNGGTCHTCVALMRDKYPCYTEQKIGDEFGGISRERVRQILKKEGRRSSSTKRDAWAKERICPRCGEKKNSKSRTCSKCFHEIHHVILTCSWCGTLFEQYQSQVLHKIQVHNQETFFCNKKCHGKYVAEHYGFKSKYTPEEAKQKRKEANKNYRKSHKEETKQRVRLWNKHTNEERISILCSLLYGAKSEVNYRKIFEVTDKVFPGLFVSLGSLRLFLWHHKDLFEVEKCGKVTLKGK